MKESLLSLKRRYQEYQNKDLSINLSRGKPCKEQLDLSNEIMDVLPSSSDFIDRKGFDVRNYGELSGIEECKRLFASLLGIDVAEIFIGGNSSLSMQYKLLLESFARGVDGNPPFSKQGHVKWLCPVPGYDRHFSMLESLGIEMINIEMDENGPDMDAIEEAVKNPSVKGIWCVPIYSNPTGITYSKEVVTRFAKLRPAAKDFRIYWDLAYFAHHLYGAKNDSLPNILELAKANGNEDMVYLFFSTSKITFAGAGVALVGASRRNIERITRLYAFETIGFDKVNQLRHVLYFKDVAGLEAHMRRHADIIRPKFERILSRLDKELKGVAWCTHPRGGYFISIFVKPGTAGKVVARCHECGLILTDAGCAYPRHHDPYDAHIRLAPTYLSLEEIDDAVEILVTSIKIEFLLKDKNSKS